MRPVFDPDLPEDDRVLMAAEPQFLDPPSQRPRWGGRVGGDVWAGLTSAALWGFLPVLAGVYYGRAVKVLGAVLQAALIAVWVVYGFAVFFLTGLALELAALVVMLAFAGESPVSRLARRHEGRLHTAADFDAADAALLTRAQTAITSVLESKVNAAGLLDDIANRVTLPRQEWDIAQTLAEMTRLRRKRPGTKSARIASMLDSHQDALDLATASLTERVAALEDYARRTRAADEAYEEWQTLQDLAEDGDAYRELLARTVRDRLATAEVDEMTERAARVEAALRSSVRDARKAGLVLLPEAS